MGVYALIAIGVGAALGAWLRWGFGLMLNAIFPTLPLGTLAANLIGCYLIGIAAEYFFQNTTVPTEARLFIITGFLGGLTTFSTFSVETVTLLLREQYSWAFAIISSHLFGSLVMTVLGMLTIKFFTQN
ncbi:MAG: fluoride efflux transporter CrcB [Nitrosomonadaceae bacterium]|jgi:CrcB protein|nr:fluoride efflux transporter CrcB [Nitrosomonadaceae bacterium]